MSRSWHASAHAPSLCRDVAAGVSSVAALGSLAAWLLRHGQHVHRLTLVVQGADEAAEKAQELSCCLTACSSAGGLGRLLVRWGDSALRVGSWAPALRTLHTLELSSDHELAITASLHSLTQLTMLRLSATNGFQFGVSSRLPPSLLMLTLGRDESGAPLPHQASG